MKLDHPAIENVRRNWRGYCIIMAALYVLLIFTVGDFVLGIPLLAGPLTLLGGVGIVGSVFAIWNPKGKAKK